jgi:hypothetical protein
MRASRCGSRWLLQTRHSSGVGKGLPLQMQRSDGSSPVLSLSAAARAALGMGRVERHSDRGRNPPPDLLGPSYQPISGDHSLPGR